MGVKEEGACIGLAPRHGFSPSSRSKGTLYVSGGQRHAKKFLFSEICSRNEVWLDLSVVL